MVLLMHQSTGSETRDAVAIEHLLQQNKKVRVRVAGNQEEVRFKIGELFGWDCVGEMKLLYEHKVTHAQEWECALHRNAMKQSVGRREREREERRALLAETEIIERGEPLTARQFADELGNAAAGVELHKFDASHIPLSVTRELRQKFSNLWTNPGQHERMRGMLGEAVASVALRENLGDEFDKLEQMHSSDIWDQLRNENLFVVSGELPDQVVFRQRDKNPDLNGFMELDALHRTVVSEEFVALDFTISNHKDFRETLRTERLKVLRDALGKDIVLIDIVLSNMPFMYERRNELMYRWHMPCSINFHNLMCEIVPSQHIVTQKPKDDILFL